MCDLLATGVRPSSTDSSFTNTCICNRYVRRPASLLLFILLASSVRIKVNCHSCPVPSLVVQLHEHSADVQYPYVTVEARSLCSPIPVTAHRWPSPQHMQRRRSASRPVCGDNFPHYLITLSQFNLPSPRIKRCLNYLGPLLILLLLLLLLLLLHVFPY